MGWSGGYEVTTAQRNTITSIAGTNTTIAPVALAYLELLNKNFTYRTNAKEGFPKYNLSGASNYFKASMVATPNPFSEFTLVALTIPTEQKWSLRITDITGRNLIYTQLASGKYELPVYANELSGNGIYFCQLLCNGKLVETLKVISLK
jgi:hypothetical protein